MTKKTWFRWPRWLSIGCVLAVELLTSGTPITLTTDKITAEELVARHLESIGPADARASVKNRVIFGNARATFRVTGVNSIDGRAVLASEGEKCLLGMIFGASNYPHEKMGFDGKTLTVGYVAPGTRSVLGNFLLTYDVILKQGLMSGTLSSAWPLLNSRNRDAKLEYAGTKKIDDRRLHELRFLPRKGSDLRISLFFDMETFQHVRTEYRREVSAQMGRTPAESAGQRETRYTMVEEFSDFKQEGKLTLPHTYQLELVIEAQSRTFMAKWVLSLEQFQFNQSIDPKSFDVVNS